MNSHILNQREKEGYIIEPVRHGPVYAALKPQKVKRVIYLFFEKFSLFLKEMFKKVVHHGRNAGVTGPRRQTGPCRTGSNKASLSFGRTSAGIVWCFWGMLHTIETTTMEYLIAELARNLMNQNNISQKMKKLQKK